MILCEPNSLCNFFVWIYDEICWFYGNRVNMNQIFDSFIDACYELINWGKFVPYFCSPWKFKYFSILRVRRNPQNLFRWFFKKNLIISKDDIVWSILKEFANIFRKECLKKMDKVWSIPPTPSEHVTTWLHIKWLSRCEFKTLSHRWTR